MLPSLVTLILISLPGYAFALTAATEITLLPTHDACQFEFVWILGAVAVLVLDLHQIAHEVFSD